MSKPRVAARILLSVMFLLTASSCRDGQSMRPIMKEGATSATLTGPVAGLRRKPVTAAELHRNNRMDFIGAHHNLVVRRFSLEFEHGAKTFPEACKKVADWLRQPSTAELLGPRMGSFDRNAMAAAIVAQPFCTSGARSTADGATRKSLRPIVPVRWRQGAEVTNWASYVISAANDATDANDLASALQPVLDATASMNETDAAEVQALVSVAQSSYELWQDGTEVQNIATSLESTWASCYAGNSIGLTLGPDSEGATWTCDGYNWIATAFRGARRGGDIFHRASLATRVPSCDPPPGWREYIVDGDIEGLLGGLFGGLAGAINGAGAISAYRAWKTAIPVVRCRYQI